MLCGCIPIGNPVFGIPTAIGSTGMLMDVREMDSQAQRLKEQLAPLQSDPPRARMAQLFTKKQRDTKLKTLLNQNNIESFKTVNKNAKSSIRLSKFRQFRRLYSEHRCGGFFGRKSCFFGSRSIAFGYLNPHPAHPKRLVYGTTPPLAPDRE